MYNRAEERSSRNAPRPRMRPRSRVPSGIARRKIYATGRSAIGHPSVLRKPLTPRSRGSRGPLMDGYLHTRTEAAAVEGGNGGL